MCALTMAEGEDTEVEVGIVSLVLFMQANIAWTKKESIMCWLFWMHRWSLLWQRRGFEWFCFV